MAQQIQIFAIYDKKGISFGLPYYALQKGQAIRGFTDAVNDPSSPYNKHPEDFTLFHLGEFNDQTGKIEPLSQPQPLEEALSVKENKPALVETKRG